MTNTNEFSDWLPTGNGVHVSITALKADGFTDDDIAVLLSYSKTEDIARYVNNKYRQIAEAPAFATYVAEHTE